MCFANKMSLRTLRNYFLGFSLLFYLPFTQKFECLSFLQICFLYARLYCITVMLYIFFFIVVSVATFTNVSFVCVLISSVLQWNNGFPSNAFKCSAENFLFFFIVFDNEKFLDYLSEIYPSQLTVEKANK